MVSLAMSSLRSLLRPARRPPTGLEPAAADALRAVRRELQARGRVEPVARLVANRIYALEQAGRPISALAEVARRELAFGAQPFAAWMDSLALASFAAQRALGLRPHLAQLKAAIHAWRGDAAELGAGEGKTMALALAAAVHALAGRPVHVVHRDDAAAIRGIGRVRRLYQELGIPVKALTAASLPRDRRLAYGTAVCYASARELLFDTLEEHAELGLVEPERLCALVDDLDQVLIDGAAANYRLTREHPQRSGQADDVVTTPQRLFRRYGVLGGLSATLPEATAAELATVYRMDTVRIASIYPDFRQDLGVRVVRGAQRLQAVLVERVRDHTAVRRPVLVVCGHRRVLLREAQALAEAGFDALVINDPLGSPQAQALAVAEAMSPFGLTDTMRTHVRPGAVMLALDEEASALDLMLEPAARAAGGPAVIALGLGPDQRADSRLRQIAARQGNPGSVEFLVDSEDPYRQPLPVRSTADRLSGLPLPTWLVTPLIQARRRRHEQGVMRARLRLARRAAVAEDSPCPEAPLTVMQPLAGTAELRTP